MRYEVLGIRDIPTLNSYKISKIEPWGCDGGLRLCLFNHEDVFLRSDQVGRFDAKVGRWAEIK